MTAAITLLVFLITVGAVRLMYLILFHWHATGRLGTRAALSAGSVLGLGIWSGQVLMFRTQGVTLTPLAEGFTALSLMLTGVAYVMTQIRFPGTGALWRALLLVLLTSAMLAVGLYNAGQLALPPGGAPVLLTALLGAWLVAALALNFEPVVDARRLSPLVIRSAGLALAITALQLASQRLIAGGSGRVIASADVTVNLTLLLLLSTGLLVTLQVRRVRSLNRALRQQAVELRRERDYHVALLSSLNDHIVITDAAGHLIGNNENAARLHTQVKTGTSVDSWAADHQLYLPDFSRLLETGEIPLYRALQGDAVDGTLIGVKSGGEHLLMACRGSAIRDEDDRIIGAVVAMNDVTVREHTLAAIKDAARLQADVIGAINDGLVLTDPHGRITVMNARIRDLLGVGATSAPQTIEDLMRHVELQGPYGAQDARPSHPYYQVLAGHASVGESTSEVVRRDGTAVWLTNRVQGIYHDQRLTGVLCVISDLTDRVQLREQLQRQALYSPLTNLPNRQQFAVLAAQENSRVPCLVLAIQCPTILQLRQSGAVNLADALAVCFSRHVTTLFPEAAALGQQDDLTFFALLPPDAPLGLERLAGPHALLGEQVTAQWKAGSALWQGYDPADVTVEHAILAASAAPTGQIEPYHESLQVRSRQDRHLDLRLRRALAHADFTVAFQPIRDFSSGRVVKAEALVRWIDDELGFVPPDQFISRAEQMGQIQVISDLVIERALEEARRASGLLGQDVRIAVNLSPLELNTDAFMRRITALVHLAPDAPRRLTFEITESAVLSTMSSVMETLRTLRALGFQIALDDFGTGYSALSMLRSLPLDQVKLDRTFIWGIETDARHLMLTRSIVTLAHDLNLDVVAEGIENAEQASLLLAMRCTYGQGYLYSRPVPVVDWLALNP